MAHGGKVCIKELKINIGFRIFSTVYQKFIEFKKEVGIFLNSIKF